MECVRITISSMLVVALVACGNRDIAGNEVVVTDSAGITIVTSRGPTWTDDEAWRVDQEHVVQIGGRDGAEEYAFDRVANALGLSDGRIVVLDGGSQELRFFDERGTFMHSAGGRGGGPGEFQSARIMFRTKGDSLFVADGRLGRFSVLDPNGEFARSYYAALGHSSPIGRLADGRLVTLNYADPASAVATGYVRAPFHLLVYTPDGEAEDTIAQLLGGGEYRAVIDIGIVNLYPAFNLERHLEVKGERIYTGTGENGYHVEVLRPDGSVRSILRADIPSRPVTDADIEDWRQRQLEGASEVVRPAVERLVAEGPVPSMMPAYSDLQVDEEDNVWLLGYEPGVRGSNEWHVFDRMGRLLGEVVTPMGLDVTDIGSDYVLGIYRDEYDVQAVRKYRIIKPQSQ